MICLFHYHLPYIKLIYQTIYQFDIFVNTKNIEEYPIPNPESNASKQIISLVSKINKTPDCEEKNELASEVDKLVEKAFCLTD